jgi:hypothetical protein
VQAAQVPSDAIPLDAPDAPPQSAADFIAAIPAADLPADPAQAQEIRDLLSYLQRVISLHKFDVSTVDPEKHGYFRIRGPHQLKIAKIDLLIPPAEVLLVH